MNKNHGDRQRVKKSNYVNVEKNRMRAEFIKLIILLLCIQLKNVHAYLK